jgi:type III secretion protein J
MRSSRPSKQVPALWKAGSKRAGQLRGLMSVLVITPLLAGCKVALDHHLSERQSNAVVATMLEHAIPAVKRTEKGGTYTVMVEQRDFARAYELQRDQGLPRRNYGSIGTVFAHKGLVASPTADQARLVYAEEQQLDSAISSINGVTGAHVLIVEPMADPLARTRPALSASVLVDAVPGSHAARMVPQMKMLVANAVRGLRYSHVSVVVVPDADVTLPGSPPIVPVLGLWVSRGSVGATKMLFGLLGAMVAVILGTAGTWLWRSRASVQARSRQLLVGVRR